MRTPYRPLCVLCHAPLYKDEGNNAWPMAEGLCCDDCDDTYIFNARRRILFEFESHVVH